MGNLDTIFGEGEPPAERKPQETAAATGSGSPDAVSPEALELFRGLHASQKFSLAAAHEAFGRQGGSGVALTPEEAEVMAISDSLECLDAMQQMPGLYRWVQLHAIWCAYHATDYGCHQKVRRFVRQAHLLIVENAEPEVRAEFLTRVKLAFDAFVRQFQIRKKQQRPNLKRWLRNCHVLAMVEGTLNGVPAHAPRQLIVALMGTSADVGELHQREMTRVRQALMDGQEPYGAYNADCMRGTLPEPADVRSRRRLVQQRLR